MSIRRCTPKIAQDQERYYIDWDDDPRGEFVFYCDHISWADHTPEVEAMRAACIAAVEALKPLLAMEKYKGGYDCCGCSTPSDLYVDVLAALREVQP